MQGYLITTNVMRVCTSALAPITQEGKPHSRLTMLRYRRRDDASITKFPHSEGSNLLASRWRVGQRSILLIATPSHPEPHEPRGHTSVCIGVFLRQLFTLCSVGGAVLLCSECVWAAESNSLECAFAGVCREKSDQTSDVSAAICRETFGETREVFRAIPRDSVDGMKVAPGLRDIRLDQSKSRREGKTREP